MCPFCQESTCALTTNPVNWSYGCGWASYSNPLIPQNFITFYKKYTPPPQYQYLGLEHRADYSFSQRSYYRLCVEYGYLHRLPSSLTAFLREKGYFEAWNLSLLEFMQQISSANS